LDVHPTATAADTLDFDIQDTQEQVVVQVDHTQPPSVVLLVTTVWLSCAHANQAYHWRTFPWRLGPLVVRTVKLRSEPLLLVALPMVEYR